MISPATPHYRWYRRLKSPLGDLGATLPIRMNSAKQLEKQLAFL